MLKIRKFTKYINMDVYEKIRHKLKTSRDILSFLPDYRIVTSPTNSLIFKRKYVMGQDIKFKVKGTHTSEGRPLVADLLSLTFNDSSDIRV